MLVPERRFPRSHFFRLLLTLVLIAVVAFASIAQVRPMEISRYVQPAPAIASTFFRGFGKFAGGVVPRGRAEFYSPAKVKLNPRELRLVILDESKLSDDESDFDVIGIAWRGRTYRLMAQDNLIYRQMRFVQRGSYIAYTIPNKYDEVYFEGASLVESCDVGGYVAKEFASLDHMEFLGEVDLDTDTEKMPQSVEAAIMQNLAGTRAIDDDDRFAGSYLNADFDVKYQVFLEESPNGDPVATVGGLPLRYQWHESAGNSVKVNKVEVFSFPEDETDLQYRAVLFFQTTAILRQFNVSNKPEFNRFLKQVESTLSSAE